MLSFLVWLFDLVFFGGEGRDLGGGVCCVILIDWDFGFLVFFFSVMRNVSVVGLAGLCL